MHKYEELEKRYYAKKIKFYLKIFIFFVVIAGFSVYIFSTKEKQNNRQKVVVKETKKVVLKENNLSKKDTQKEIASKIKKVVKGNNTTKAKKENNITKKVEEKKIEKPKKHLIFLPLIPKIELTKEYKLTLKPMYPNLDKKVEVKKDIKIKKKELKPVKVIKKAEVKTKIVQKPQKNLITSKEVNVILLMNKFESQKTYENAIKIAQILYNKGNFQKAIEWSFKANTINPSDYKSWLIYGQSLYKLGKRTKAIKILSGYINNYGSNKSIEDFLEKIK